MISRFLKAKHWQLFTLFFGISLLFQMMYFVAMFTSVSPGGGSLEALANLVFVLSPVIMVLTMGLLLGWLYSVGAGLQEQVPSELRRPTRLFKVALVFPTAYILIFVFIMFSFISLVATSVGGAYLLFIIIPLHLFAMFCIVYTMYFSAKTIKLAELKRPVTFGEFAGEFFLIWFFPIGIWILQPKINKLVQPVSADRDEEEYV